MMTSTRGSSLIVRDVEFALRRVPLQKLPEEDDAIAVDDAEQAVGRGFETSAVGAHRSW